MNTAEAIITPHTEGMNITGQRKTKKLSCADWEYLKDAAARLQGEWWFRAIDLQATRIGR